MGSIEVFDEFVRTELLKLMKDSKKDSKVQYHSRLAQVAADAVLDRRPLRVRRRMCDTHRATCVLGSRLTKGESMRA